MLLQGPPELSTNPHISFGLQQLYPELVQQSNPSVWSEAALELPKQAVQPFAALGVTPAMPRQHSSEDEEDFPKREQPYHFRQIVIRNKSAQDVHLVDVRLSEILPALPHTFAVLDDHQLTQGKKAYCTKNAVKTGHGDGAEEKSPHGSSQESLSTKSQPTQSDQSQQSGHADQMRHDSPKAVLLSPGNEYQVTVALHCRDGPYRK